MPDRHYKQVEIDILKSYYGGIDSDWNVFTLKPDGNLINEYTSLLPEFFTPDQKTVMTAPTGDIYYANDWRYSDDYSTLTFSNPNSAKEIHTFIHEGWHQVQTMHTSEFLYVNVVGDDAHEGNYNYGNAFSGTPFYKLSSEQQAEFFADYYLLKHGGSSYINLSKKGGDVGTHSAAEYDTVYLNATSDGLNSLVAKTVAFDTQQDHKNRYNDDIGGQAMPSGDDGDGATVDAGYIEEIFQIFGSAMTRSSPLVLDIDGDGVELVSLHSSNSVYFDIDSAQNDGMAEATGWVAGGDGLLTIDLNSDGIVNNSSELFGDQTGYSNGFKALKLYDSNGDNLISSQDSVWGSLRVWIEESVDGVGETHELHTLSELGITSISTTWTDVNVAANDNKKVAERPAARLLNLKRWAA